jgi:Skp family chaperone for outer membrane proteins
VPYRFNQTASFIKVLNEKGDLYLKYRVLDGSVDGNGHGVSAESMQRNFKSIVGKPYIEVPKEANNVPGGKYTKYHPYDRLYNTTLENELKASAEFTKGIAADFSFQSQYEPRKQKDSGYVSIKITDPITQKRYIEHPETIPKQVSLAMIVYDPENEPNVTDWEIAHIAAVGNDSNAAFPNMKPVGGCLGGSECLGELKASALKLRDDSFKVSENKIHLSIMPEGKDEQKKDPLNKFTVQPPKNSEPPKENPKASGEALNEKKDEKYSNLQTTVEKLTGLVESLVKRNEDEDKLKRESAIKQLVTEDLIGKIYADKESYEKDLEAKINSNHSLSEISEIINSKKLAVDAATLISRSPELMQNPDFANIPNNVLVASAKKEPEMSDKEKIARMRMISSFYGNDGGIG